MGKARFEGKEPVSKTERILVTVKTYPTLSSKYGELVCTAGVREDGSWVRIYPIPFRRLADYQRFQKYTWIEVELVRRGDDARPETYSPAPDWHDIRKHEHIGTSTQGWEERKAIVLRKSAVYDDLTELIKRAKKNELSLAVFAPTRVKDFTWEKVESEWDAARLRKATHVFKQGDLFHPADFLEDFKIVRKVPYKFSFTLVDSKGRESTMMIEDWEVGELFWKCQRSSTSETEALAKVHAKYMDDLVRNRDFHFFLGTTKLFHMRAPNPFIIIGAFYPPRTKQLSFGF